MLNTLYKSFWKAEYWLPPGYTWADLEDSDGITYPHPRDLLAAIPLTFVLIIIRYGIERIIGLPLSRALGVHDPVRIKATPNHILESFFQTQNKNPKKKPWFGQPETVWNGYPKQPLQPSIYWWYLWELSFYFSLLLTLTFDVKRKDFKEQVLHHFVTITLISFSYSANFVRIGALVLLLHDVSDIFMEACKMLIYAQWSQARDMMFILFALVFFISRLILFPIKVLYTTSYAFLTNYQVFFGYYLANALLMVLQGLNAFWFFLILRMFYKLLSEGQVKNDVRSDIEEEESSDEQLIVTEGRNGRLQSNDTRNIRARGSLKNWPVSH
ncbi:ceramide synthase 4-like isoform X2 [Petaurus breviceps papuanus]|uniref:ceramide synthase 4-like isoform X2 n=1 Tax=Petaurus breviceps papuanus TaxID=3040969 RepID=UPI0036D8C98C